MISTSFHAKTISQSAFDVLLMALCRFMICKLVRYFNNLWYDKIIPSSITTKNPFSIKTMYLHILETDFAFDLGSVWNVPVLYTWLYKLKFIIFELQYKNTPSWICYTHLQFQYGKFRISLDFRNVIYGQSNLKWKRYVANTRQLKFAYVIYLDRSVTWQKTRLNASFKSVCLPL